MTEEHDHPRRAEIRQQIAELERELLTLPQTSTVSRLLEQNRERATAPNALTPKRSSP
jgi:hypothetical protein